MAFGHVGKLPPEYIAALQGGSIFQVVEGWNIESFLDTKGGLHKFNCTTKKSHYSAFVIYNYLENIVKLTWDEGAGVIETAFIPDEKDVNKILKWVDDSITSRMIHEAMSFRDFLRSRGNIVCD